MLWLLTLALGWADTCNAWGPATDAIEVRGGLVSESSGLAASVTRPGVLYTHDDHNGPRSLYAFSLDGKYLGEHEVKGGINEDWEALDAAPCPDKGDCLYIGDIGDNDGTRYEIRVLIAREPEGEGDNAKVMRTLKATYPGGNRDAEALLVHPCTGDVYVVSKGASDRVAIHRFPPDAHKKTKQLIEVANFELPGTDPELGSAFKITGGSFDADGDRVVLRSELDVWEWLVDPDDPEVHWLDPPTVLDLPLADSEAITYTLDGNLVSSSEGAPMTMAWMDCEDLLPPEGECVFEYQPGCGCDSSRSTPVVGGFLVIFFMLYSRSRLDV